MKKVSFLYILFLSSLFSKELELKSFLGYEYKAYLKKNEGKKEFNSAITFQNELKYSFKDSKIYTKIEALKDFDEKQRDYFNLTEAYYLNSFENFDFYLGKRVIFLGSLEAYNLVDIFNRQNYQRDFLSDYKKGTFLTGINYYFEDNSRLNLYIKGFEEKIKFPDKSSPYYAFGNYEYDEKLLFANGKEKPSFLLSYSKSYDEDISADVSYGFFYGYDNNTVFKKNNNKYQTMLFQSMKFLTYDTFVVEGILFKIEGAYTKIIEDEKLKLNDFYELGFGVEYTIESIIKNHNLGLVGEYYKSDNTFSSLNNDLFLALRYSLNDADSSEFLFGGIKDLKDEQFSVYGKYEGRLTDYLKLSTDLRYIKSSSFLDEHLRFSCEIKYYF